MKIELELNRRAGHMAESLISDPKRYGVKVHEVNGAQVVDCGIDTPGGTAAGLIVARTCLAGLGRVQLVGVTSDDVGMARVNVSTDHPVAACMASQYAGWRIGLENYFAMGSGPMRALAKTEPLFQHFDASEPDDAAVGILETSQIPDEAVIAHISEKTRVAPSHIQLLVAPTASIAGCLQIVARSLETCLHKLHELEFDISQVASGSGTAPLPTVAHDDLGAIGRTNDAILYGASVTLWCRTNDELIESIGPRVPACASTDYGDPFSEIFRRAGHDFYKIDPHLFSPAEIILHNMNSGNSFGFGKRDEGVLRRSFGL